MIKIKEDNIIAGHYMDKNHNEILEKIDETIIPKKIKHKKSKLGKQYTKTLEDIKNSMNIIKKEHES
jgi:hypothetical protein